MLAQSTLRLQPPSGYGQAARLLRGPVDPKLSPSAEATPPVDEVPVRELADVTRGLPLSAAAAEQVQALADSGRPPFGLSQAVRALLAADETPAPLVLEITRRATRWAKKKAADAPKTKRPAVGTPAALNLRKSLHLPTAMRNLRDRRGEAPFCGCGTQMQACRCRVTATHDGWSCPGCGAHGGDEAQTRTPEDLREPEVGPPPANNRKTHPFVGTVRFHGLPLIRLENLKGSTRSGADSDGNAWSVTMPAHYGEFARTEGADGDPVDVFVGPNRHAPKAYVIHLQDPVTGEHDEDKVFVGFDSAEDARSCFRGAYNRDDLKMGPVRSMTTSELAEWLAERDNRGRKIETGALLSKAVQENDMSLSNGKHFLDEDLAQKAHAAVAEQYGLGEKDGERYWKLKTAIYQKMGGTFEKSQADEADEAAELLRSAGGLPTSQTYGTPAKTEKPAAASPPPAPPPVARPHHHQDTMQLPTKPTKKFPPPSHPKDTKAPLKTMSTPGEMMKAQRHDADELLKAAGGEPEPVRRYSVAAPAGKKAAKKPAAPVQSPDLARLADHHEKMGKMHAKAYEEAANAGDGELAKKHTDAEMAHREAATAARGGGGAATSTASQKAKDATEATLPKADAGKGSPAGKASEGKPAAAAPAAGGAQAQGIGGRSKEGLKVIAIEPRGGKIVGYTTKDGKQKAIYEGSQAAEKLAATVATHAEPPKAEPDAKDAAAPATAAGDAATDAAAADAPAPAGKGGDYHRAKQAEHAKAAATASKAGDTATADKHLAAARAHWDASLQNDKGTKGEDAAGASEWADEVSAKVGPGEADDAAAPATGDATPPADGASGDQGAAPAPTTPSEPIDDKPLSPDEPAGGTPSDAPDPEAIGSASPKTDSPESRHAEEIAKMRGQVEDAHKKLAALAHHIDANLVPMFNNLKGQARAAHRNPNPSVVGWLLAQIGRFASFVLGLHEDKGKVTSAADAMNGKTGQGATGTDGREFDMNPDGSFTETKDSKAKQAAKAAKPAPKAKLPQTRIIEKSLTASDAGDLEGTCVSLLSTLQAIERLHHSAHLQAQGPEAYSDHLLFQRLYTDVQHEIDGLSEKMVATFGPGVVDADARAADAAELLDEWQSNDDGPVERALAAELELQDAISGALPQDGLSAGMENFLQGLADAHETAIYLLQQRLSPAVSKSVRANTSRQAYEAGALLKSANALG